MKQIKNWNLFFLQEAKLQDFSVFHGQKKNPETEIKL